MLALDNVEIGEATEDEDNLPAPYLDKIPPPSDPIQEMEILDDTIYEDDDMFHVDEFEDEDECTLGNFVNRL